jgi:protein required for attachment to host cells
MQTSTWVLVADGAKARLFAMEKDRSLTEIEDFLNPDGRRERAPIQDRPPRTHDRFRTAQHAFEPRTTAEEKADEIFARELEATLERGRVGNRYRDLILIAPPHFLGALKAALGEHVRTSVVAELPKDLTHADTAEILDHIPARH